MKKRQSALSALLLCFLVAVLLLTGCGKSEPEPTALPAPTPTEAPTPEPTPTPEPIVAELDEVRALMNGGQSYAAFQRLVALEDQYRGEPEHLKACEALFDELDTLLQAAEPASGTEYHRNFPVQGGCVLEVSAFSGPVLVTVTDEFAVLDQKPNPGTVSLYVRQGEQAETHLPAGTYRIRYQVGYRWFGEEIGFGEYCTEGELEPMEFDFYMNGDWASNAKFKITL